MRSPQVVSSMFEVCSAFFDHLERPELLKRILDAAIHLTSSDRGTVFLSPRDISVNNSKSELQSFVATGLDGRVITVNATQGIAGYVYTSGEALIINDVQTDPRFYSKIDFQTQYRTINIIAAPLVTRDNKTIGVIEVLNSSKGAFADEDLKILKVLALFAAIALEQREAIDNLSNQKVQLEQERLSLEKKSNNTNLKSSHPELQQLYEKIPVFAESDSNILIEGESGTGKEIIAQLIHANSCRSCHPFVAVNCAAITESLFEAELFGVTKGAATDTAARKGKIELAAGGTLFLDEIGELSPAAQSKLLRALQEKTITPVGSDKAPVLVDFRLIAATNADLKALVDAGKFREDLFYRINVIRIHLPALRERAEDIPELCSSIMENFTKNRGWPIKQIHPDAMLHLQAYAWPGNIRQLQNQLESAMIMSGQKPELLLEDFQLSTDSASPIKHGLGVKLTSGFNMKAAKDSLERELISRALRESGGNKTRAARMLGLTREGLRKALQKMGTIEQF